MKSESIGKLAAALAAAQGEMRGALKDSENPFFRSRYADLASVWDACRAALAKHELAVVQLVKEPPAGSDRAVVETTLIHSSSEWISETLSLPVLGPDLKGGERGDVNAQSYGSAITYARRYGLAAIVGVYQEDDDANTASAKREEPKRMDETALAMHLSLITGAKDLNELKAKFGTAIKDAGPDQGAQKSLIAAKDARKAALTPPPAAAKDEKDVVLS